MLQARLISKVRRPKEVSGPKAMLIGDDIYEPNKRKSGVKHEEGYMIR